VDTVHQVGLVAKIAQCGRKRVLFLGWHIQPIDRGSVHCYRASFVLSHVAGCLLRHYSP